jgi:hypothetical protein
MSRITAALVRPMRQFTPHFWAMTFTSCIFMVSISFPVDK